MRYIPGIVLALLLSLPLFGRPEISHAAAEIRGKVEAALPHAAGGENTAAQTENAAAKAIEEALKKAASHVGQSNSDQAAEPGESDNRQMPEPGTPDMDAPGLEARDNEVNVPEDGGKANQPDESALPADEARTAETNGQNDASEADGPTQETFAGVQNQHLLVGGSGEPQINVWYPKFDNSSVDADIYAFVEKITGEYREDVAAGASDGEQPENYDKWEFTATFEVNRPSRNVVSITFHTYAYSGGAHGNISITCLNYDIAGGRRLNFDDLFGNPELALELMSKLSAQKLAKALGEDADAAMIEDGTAPLPQNFRNLTLVPNGLYIEFQPYQVGPWSIGPQRAHIQLGELAPANPNPAVWKAGNESSIKK